MPKIIIFVFDVITRDDGDNRHTTTTVNFKISSSKSCTLANIAINFSTVSFTMAT